MKIDAARQFQPTEDLVQGILSAYNLRLINFESAESGIENCTLFVATSDGDYVLRVYRKEKKSDNDIAAELEFVEYLADHDIPVALAIKNSVGECLTKYKGWQSILMRKISGKHETSYDSALVESLSVTQAKMHRLALEYRGTSPSKQPVSFLQDEIFLPEVDVAALNPTAQLLIGRAVDYTVMLPEGLPSGLCHLDYDIDNILVNEQHQITAVLDFDDLTPAPFVVCLSYALWDIMSCGQIDFAGDYLATYSLHRELTGAELELIPAIMLFRHYMVASIIVLDGVMDQNRAEKYVRIENSILNWRATV